ncbi:MAG: glycosyltransferase family 4 protein [Ignavibacteria bacterium]|nr:glycosyltransferase family 4 protein [Ignavibacteria bacterium]
MKRKKLLFILLSSAFGGLELHSIEFCKWMQERGWDINILGAKDTKVIDEAEKRNLRVYSIEKPKKYFDIIKLRKALNLIKSIEPDIIFVSDNNDLNFAVLLKKFYRKRLSLIYILHMQIGVKKRDLYHRFIFSNVDKWIVPLEYLKLQTLEKTTISENKIEVIKHSSDVNKLIQNKINKTQSRKILGLPEKGFIIGMNARIDIQKNQHFVINALEKIIKEFDKKIFLYILGKPTLNEGQQYLKYLYDLVQEKELFNYIFFKDYIEDISIFYNAIDSLIIATEFETYGQNTIEAIISTIPVIGTNTGGTREILQDVCMELLYEPNNTGQLVEKILYLQENYDYFKNKILQSSIQFSYIYSHQKECESYEKLIANL